MSNTASLRPQPAASAHTPLKARNVAFDWADTPLHWIPGDPFSTHTINVLHLLLPAGERWFVHVYKQVLPYIRDPRLREDVIGFIGQEAMHSQAHDEVLPHLKEQGLDPAPYTAQVDWLFEKLLGDRTLPPGCLRCPGHPAYAPSCWSPLRHWPPGARCADGSRPPLCGRCPRWSTRSPGRAARRRRPGS